MATAGRAVLVSGAIIVLSLASLLIFPQIFLRSMGLGGSAAVLGAALGALTVLPALLAILGPRINALRIPLPRTHATAPGQGWARLAHAVMRRPVRTLIPVVALLAVLTLPFAHVRFGGADERVLPEGTPARTVAEHVHADFPHDIPTSPIRVLLDGGGADQADRLAERIRALPSVTAVQVTAVHEGRAALITVGYTGEATGDGAYEAVRGLRALPTPPGTTTLVGGAPAVDLDLVHDLGARLPWLTLAMLGVTTVLLAVAFGSVVLPVKAVLMNLVSIGASFGAVVWVFQDGHLSGVLGFTPTGYLEPNLPVLIFAVLFGLATDYEVFLLSRVREAWDHTGDNRTAVAAGLQHTGRIITAAALLLVLVVAGFTTGQVVFAKLIGVGMITAVVIDATLVRTLLVPATMRLLGRWNWWAPPPLARLHRRTGPDTTTTAPATAAAPLITEAAR
ncbi:MMPL family transporter [Dactylosporangium cerinum]|uniref:MMPL family transporter n=1 Tax=Dactylosporangium cerinum TaxID=1434730 RepID=A0ABV9W439_9ACTN